jgi:hypothetical protein
VTSTFCGEGRLGFSCDRVLRFVSRVGGINLKEEGMRKVLSLLLTCALVLSVASVAFAGDTQTVNGWISDSKCGVKGANEKSEACTKKCIEAGASPVVVTDKDQKVLTVENPDTLKDHYGHHVAVTGKVTGDKIHVDSVKML